MDTNQDTIAAIATPAGIGGVGIIRISGPQAKAIAQTISQQKKLKVRQAHFSAFYNNEQQTIDSGLMLWFQAPASFTGEDVVELQGHGGTVVMGMLLKRVLELGARMARPGEFSERAFHNEKIDLLQAEAIADLIAGGSEQAVLAAQRSLQGTFSQHINEILKLLIETRVWVESAIDFPEEEIDFLSDAHLHQQLHKLNTTLKDTLQKTQTGVVLNQGINIAIIGKPNAGKSSLLNRLTEQDTAIISDIAGTTRDVIKEDVVIAGVPVRLVDTAGIHETDNPIEQQGIARALQAKQQADVVLHVFDGQHPVGQSVAPTTNHIQVMNKVDVLHPDNQSIEGFIQVSAKTQQGIESLKQAIVDHINLGPLSEGTFTARQRHIAQLERTQQYIDAAEQQLKANQGELSAEELRLAQDTLSAITGAYSSDDLLGEIFSSFCIGK